MTSTQSEPGAKLALSVEGLVKEYKGGLKAVDGLSFQIGRGEVYALLGPNGAGKTTTIRTVVTLLRPTAGTVKVAGHDVLTDADAARAKLGYVPQEIALDRYLSGRQHLELSARLYRVPKETAKERIEALLEVVELSDRADDGIKTYSGGMKKRLEIACGLIHQPELLVLDEPTQGLDIQTRYRIWDFVAELREKGTSVLLTTHDMEEADQLADRIGIVDHGKLQAEGTSVELKAGFGGERVKVDLGRGSLSEEQRQALSELEGATDLEVRGRSLLL
ncbi:MAG: ABC transporter ATP-binding protein, partial [Planctomycetes bacterium]|nr:ABC transporter ATP-binding protein [Planctomycetota bacterium]